MLLRGEERKDGTLYWLELVRFFAATLVVFAHLSWNVDFYGLDCGEIGVEIFFVMSGIVIALSTQRSGDLRRFFVNRVSRIVPLYWFVTGAVVVGMFVAPSLFTSSTPTASEIVKSFMFVPYLQESGKVLPLVEVGWTLCLEMVFYAIYAGSMAISYKWRNAIAVGVLVGLVGLGLVLQPVNPMVAFYLTPKWLAFAFGVGIAVGLARIQAQPLGQGRTVAVSGAMAVFLGVCLVVPAIGQVAADTKLVWGVLMGMLVLLEVQFGGMKFGWVKTAGAITYALYICNLYVIIAGQKVLGRLGLPEIFVGLGLVGASMVVSFGLWKWVDAPGAKACRNWLNGLGRREPVILDRAVVAERVEEPVEPEVVK